MQAAPPWALRSSAALAPGLAMPRAPATELVFWHRVSDCAPRGCGLLFCFLFLCYLFALSALARWSLRFHSPRLCRVAIFLKIPVPYKPTSFSYSTPHLWSLMSLSLRFHSFRLCRIAVFLKIPVPYKPTSPSSEDRVAFIVSSCGCCFCLRTARRHANSRSHHLVHERAQPNTARFTYRRAAFFHTLTSKTGLMVARAAALCININTDSRPMTTSQRRRTSSSLCAPPLLSAACCVPYFDLLDH